ncbi:MAG: hypothetical protein ACFUZC_07595 [Chthoniobacteraceae bacterium]
MNVRCKVDTSKVQAAIKNLAPYVKKSRKELVEQAAKGFVRTVATVTPPASKGVTGSAAKKQGEATITKDLGRVMAPVRPKRSAQLQSAVDIYRRFRDKNTGRINPRNLKNPYPVSSAEYNALRKMLFARVGWLASGWNPAAKKLGVRLPAWIARHSGPGGIIPTSDGRRFRLEVTNAVKFVGSVKNYEGRIAKAVQYQANAMQRQADYLLKKSVKQAGF